MHISRYSFCLARTSIGSHLLYTRYVSVYKLHTDLLSIASSIVFLVMHKCTVYIKFNVPNEGLISLALILKVLCRESLCIHLATIACSVIYFLS